MIRCFRPGKNRLILYKTQQRTGITGVLPVIPDIPAFKTTQLETIHDYEFDIHKIADENS
jgi:hypothetical protein